MATAMIGGTRTQREYNLGLQRKFLQELYNLEQPNKEFRASALKYAEKTGIPSNIVSDVIQLLEKANLLTRRYEWNGGHGNGGGGRQAYWTLMTNYEHANNVLARHQQAQLAKPARGNLSKPAANVEQMESFPALPEVEPEAITKPNRNDDVIRDVNLPDKVSAAKAVVDNVRNYLNAQQLAKSNLAQLRAAGMNVNEEAYFASIQMIPNTEADAIALVMPYIEFCESRISKLRK